MQVLKDFPNPNNPPGSDEGRAMMQIVHDVAPGANLDFYTAFVSEQDFAAGILALANAGCRVICDDILYFAEPFYQTGVVGKAIQTVEQEGVIFLTSSNNSDSLGYQAAWNPIQTATVGSTVLRDTQNFGNGSPTQTVTVGASQNVSNATLRRSMESALRRSEIEPRSRGVLKQRRRRDRHGEWERSLHHIHAPTGEHLYDCRSKPVRSRSGPYQRGLHQPCHAGHDQRCKLGHGAGSRNIALRPRGGSGECGEYSGPGRHTLQSENFSASGAGTQLWFNNDGSAIPGGPFVYNPVAVSGIDNIETTVPNFDPFFGTSAAAPSVAGVVADMLQANPNLTFARAKQILQQTALPFGDPLVAGAGLVDAAAAVQLAMQTATFATTANLVLRTNALDPSGLNTSLNQTLYRIYSIGSDALLAANQLGNVGSDWGFVTLGGFFDGDTADMLLRNATSGAFQVYNIAPNSINLTGSASLGAVGLNWQFSGTGNFSSLGETDMLLRDANSGGLQVYDIKDNQITGSVFMGAVGLNWQSSGIGNFSGRGTSDMLLRDANTGGLQAYNINSNQVTGSAFIGTVGVDW